MGPRATVIRRPSRTKVNTFPYWERSEVKIIYWSGFTHLLATAVKEPHGVHSILDSGAYDGYPMKDDWGETLVARQKLKGNRSDRFIPPRRVRRSAYTLVEHVENDDHYRERGEGGKEFGVADICETRKREVLQREKCCQVSRHREEDEGELTRPKR